jgi:hypothetical protein
MRELPAVLDRWRANRGAAGDGGHRRWPSRHPFDAAGLDGHAGGDPGKPDQRL